MRSIVIFRFFSHLSLLFVYQCITFLPLIFRFSFYIRGYTETKKSDCDSDDGKQILDLVFKNLADSHFQVVFEHDVMFLSLLCFCFYYSVLITSAGLVAAALLT